jgi:DNA primase
MKTSVSRWTRRPASRFNKALLPPAGYFYRRELKLVGHGVWRSARCPFHSDKHPSLRVNTSTGAFRCFVCDAHGGDVLAFYCLRTGAGFVEAAKALNAWEER